MRRQASNRYLLARLRPLRRPIVWAPSIVMVLLGLFTWELGSRPAGMSNFGVTSSPIDASVSREDQAVGADIDSTPLLMRASRINPYAALFPPAASDTPAPSTALIEAASPIQPSPTSNTVAPQQFGLPNAAQPLTPTAPAFSAATPLPQNQLQSAMSQLSPSSTASSSNPGFRSSINGATPSVPSGLSSAPIEGTTPDRASGNSYTNLVEGARPLSIEPNSVPNITPSIPPTPETVAPVPTPQSSVEASPNFGTIQNDSRTNSQPFTAPRSTPGRYIGGGTINTFSNP